MRTRSFLRRSVLLFLLCPLLAFGARTSSAVRIEGLVPHGPLGPPGLGYEHVVFVCSAIVHVNFFFGSPDMSPPSSEVLDLGQPFSRAVDWDIRSQEGGEPVTVDAQLISTALQREGQEIPLSDVSTLRAGEMVTATYRFENLPLGTFVVRARIRDQSGSILSLSPAARLIVSTGNESPALRALFLRDRTRRLEKNRDGSFEEYASLMHELMELQPNDPGIPERLADASIGRVPPEETMALYDRALAISERNLSERYGSIADAPEKIARLWANVRDDLQSFGRIYPEFAARPDELRIEVLTIEGTKRATLVDREGRPVPLRRGE